MKRVFAELDCPETQIWGCFCPACKSYQSYEQPGCGGTQTACPDCRSQFIVTFYE